MKTINGKLIFVSHRSNYRYSFDYEFFSKSSPIFICLNFFFPFFEREIPSIKKLSRRNHHRFFIKTFFKKVRKF